MRPPSVLAVTTLLLSAAVSAQALVAQNVPVADSGARVRIWTEQGRETGYLARLTPDSVWLRSDEATPLLAWPRGTVQRLEVSRGRKGHFWLGLAAGTVAGFIAGKLVADATAESGDNIGAGIAGLGIWLGGTVAGGVTGALIRTERWRPAAWPPDQPPAEVVSRSP
jgi:hypothetical protein